MRFGLNQFGWASRRRGGSTPAPPNTLVAGTGTFVLTGDDMAPLVDRILPSAVGTFTLTGQDATLTKSSSYTGPGDVVSGAIGWYSPARAYTAAFAATGAAIMDLVDQAGANPVTINILATGYVDLTAISNWVSANSVTTIRVTKLYDQSGSGNHVTSATLAQMPALVLNSLNGLPGLFSTNARGDRLLSGNVTRAQPVTFSTVAKRTAGTGACGWVGSNTGSMPGLYPGTGANTWSVSGGTPLLGTASDNAFHAGQAVLNGASSAIVIDGSATTGAGGSTGYSATPISLLRANGNSVDGVMMEAGVWPSAFTTTPTTGQAALIEANQRGSSGYGSF